MEDLKHLVLLMVGILVDFTVVMTMVAYTVLAERRILGFIQGRLGPNSVGPAGCLPPNAEPSEHSRTTIGTLRDHGLEFDLGAARWIHCLSDRGNCRDEPRALRLAGSRNGTRRRVSY